MRLLQGWPRPAVNYPHPLCGQLSPGTHHQTTSTPVTIPIQATYLAPVGGSAARCWLRVSHYQYQHDIPRL